MCTTFAEVIADQFFPHSFTVCPKIIDFVVPPVVFVGSQERIYVTIQANPPVEVPNFSIYLQPQYREIAFFPVKGTVLNITYVYIFEVPSDITLENEQEIGVYVSVSASANSQCVFASQGKTIQKIRNGEQ